MQNKHSEKIVVALDVETKEDALNIVRELKSYFKIFKIGKQMFTRYGPEIVRDVKSLGAEVFLDLKYHDIPNTVAGACREAVRLGVKILNVHAMGGFDMMKAAVSMVDKTCVEESLPRPVLLAVTILTSMDDAALRGVAIENTVPDQVALLAALAKKSGMDGVVASALEVDLIKKNIASPFVVLTPGIRPAFASHGDQKRVMSPAEALAKGVDYMVIGRPIVEAKDRQEAALKIINELI